MNVNEVVERFETRLHTVEGTVNRNLGRDRTLLWFAGASVALVSGSLIAAICGLIWLGNLRSDVTHLEKELEKEALGLKKEIVEQKEAHKYLTELFIRSKLHMTSYNMSKIIAIAKDQITVETEEKERVTHKVSPNTLILVNGKRAQVSDLKEGMEVNIVVGDQGEVLEIEDMSHPSLAPEKPSSPDKLPAPKKPFEKLPHTLPLNKPKGETLPNKPPADK